MCTPTARMIDCGLLALSLCAAAIGGEEKTRKITEDSTFEKDIEIMAGEKLIVSPGVRLKFAPGVGIICRGVLEIKATAEKTVFFVAKDSDKGWGNILLLGAGTAGSVMEHCELSGGRGRRIKFKAKGEFERIAEKDDKKNTLKCGGALFVYMADKVTVRCCVFKGNQAYWGGAISCWAKAAPLIERCCFVGNGAYWGGGVHCWGRSAATIRLCYFSGNRADKKNGDGGAVQFMNGSDGRLENCYLVGNSAKWGGALHFLQQSKPVITANHITKYTAWRNASAISCFGYGNPIITENCIAWNHVKADKGVAIATVAHSQPAIKGNYIREHTNEKEKEANLDANKSFRGKPDKSTCEAQEAAGIKEVLNALGKTGVTSLMLEVKRSGAKAKVDAETPK